MAIIIKNTLWVNSKFQAMLNKLKVDKSLENVMTLQCLAQSDKNDKIFQELIIAITTAKHQYFTLV